MDAPTWSSEQRFGLVVQNSVAAVPAWAPIGYDARYYREYLGEDGSDGLVEVLAHHRDRWGHVERFDDFVDLLTFERVRRGRLGPARRRRRDDARGGPRPRPRRMVLVECTRF